MKSFTTILVLLILGSCDCQIVHQGFQRAESSAPQDLETSPAMVRPSVMLLQSPNSKNFRPVPIVQNVGSWQPLKTPPQQQFHSELSNYSSSPLILHSVDSIKQVHIPLSVQKKFPSLVSDVPNYYSRAFPPSLRTSPKHVITKYPLVVEPYSFQSEANNLEEVVRKERQAASDKLEQRINQFESSCIGVTDLILTLLEANRHDQNILIHKLRKKITERNVLTSSKLVQESKVPIVTPSPTLQLKDFQRRRPSNQEQKTIRRPPSNPEQRRSKPVRENLRRPPRKQSEDTRNQLKDQQGSSDRSKQQSFANFPSFRRNSIPLHTTLPTVLNKNPAEIVDRRQSRNRNPSAKNVKPESSSTSTTIPKRRQFETTRPTKKDVHIINVQEQSQFVTPNTRQQGRRRQTTQTPPTTQQQSPQPNFRDRELTERTTQVSSTQRNSKNFQSRRNNNRDNSQESGTFTIEQFLKRYPEVRRVSARYKNRSPQRTSIKTSTTPKSRNSNKVTRRERVTVTPQPNRRKTTTRPPQTPTPTKRFKTTPPAPSPQPRLALQKEAVDEDFYELSSDDYSYLYYEEYYDELVPPHHRFKQGNHREQEPNENRQAANKSQSKNPRPKEKLNTQSIRNDKPLRAVGTRRPPSNVASTTSLRIKPKKNVIHRQNGNTRPAQSSTRPQPQQASNTVPSPAGVGQEVSSDLKMSGPFGYPERGKFFTDGLVAEFPQSIDIIYQGFIWTIDVTYPENGKMKHGGIHSILKDKVRKARINLKDDKVIRISGRASPYNINRLMFYTANGRTYGPYGERRSEDSTDFDVSAPAGHALSYISGSVDFGVPFRSISFHWKPVN